MARRAIIMALQSISSASELDAQEVAKVVPNIYTVYPNSYPSNQTSKSNGYDEEVLYDPADKEAIIIGPEANGGSTLYSERSVANMRFLCPRLGAGLPAKNSCLIDITLLAASWCALSRNVN